MVTKFLIVGVRHGRADHVFRDRFSGLHPARARHRSPGARPRRPPDDPAAGGGDAAVDGRDPGRQGPVARRIRDVGAAARDERRPAEGQDHDPACRTGQEVRSDQPDEVRARREERNDLPARGARKVREGTAARHRRGIRGKDTVAARGRDEAVRQAERAGEDRQPAVGPLAGRGSATGRARRRQHADHRPAAPRQRRRARIHRGAAEAFAHA